MINKAFYQSTFPGYKILSIVEGGMGCACFLQEDEPNGKKFVAKLIRSDLIGNPKIHKKFMEEARLSLSFPPFPYIAQAIYLDSNQSQPYLLMQWIDGWTLEEWVRIAPRFDRPLPVPEEATLWWEALLQSQVCAFHPASVLHYSLQICLGLEWLYQNKIKAHGDIHSRNIMIDRRVPQAVVLDLGLARITDMSLQDIGSIGEKKEIVGCIPYIAPELLRGDVETSPCTDIYSLGATIYVALSGHFPYHSFLPWQKVETTFKNLQEELKNSKPKILPDISEKYQRCILRCIAPNPEDRYQNILQLRQAITEILWDDYYLEVTVSAEEPDDDYKQNLIAHKAMQAIALTNSLDTIDEGIKILREILEIDPKNVNAATLNQLALALYKKGDYEQARVIIEQAAQFDGKDYFVLNSQGIIYTDLKEYDQAILALQGAINESKNDAEKRVALVNLSNAFRRNNQLQQADEALQQSIELGEDPRILIEAARVIHRKEDIKGAYSILSRILELDPLFLEAWVAIGSILRNDLGRSQDAYEIYKQALEIFPNNADLLVAMAYSGAEAGRSRGEVLSLLNRAESLGRDDAEINALRAGGLEGDEAVYYANKALKQDPTNAMARKVLEMWSRGELQKRKRNSRTIEVPLENLLDGLALDESSISAYTQLIPRLIESIANSDVPLTGTMLESMLGNIDRLSLRTLCNRIYSVYLAHANDDPYIERSADALKKLSDYLTKTE